MAPSPLLGPVSSRMSSARYTSNSVGFPPALKIRRTRQRSKHTNTPAPLSTRLACFHWSARSMLIQDTHTHLPPAAPGNSRRLLLSWTKASAVVPASRVQRSILPRIPLRKTSNQPLLEQTDARYSTLAYSHTHTLHCGRSLLAIKIEGKHRGRNGGEQKIKTVFTTLLLCDPGWCVKHMPNGV